jgi:hypothetical protein
MEPGIVVLSAVVVFSIFVLAIDRISRKPKKVWEHRRAQLRLRAVGPCAVAVGVYKTYEDRKHLEKMYSEDMN